MYRELFTLFRAGIVVHQKIVGGTIYPSYEVGKSINIDIVPLLVWKCSSGKLLACLFSIYTNFEMSRLERYVHMIHIMIYILTFLLKFPNRNGKFEFLKISAEKARLLI